jgi:hypothetical protein
MGAPVDAPNSSGLPPAECLREVEVGVVLMVGHTWLSTRCVLRSTGPKAEGGGDQNLEVSVMLLQREAQVAYRFTLHTV